MSECVRCGAEIRWVEITDGGKLIPLDARATANGTYALDPNNVGRAFPITRPGLYGHNDHNETCGQPIR